MAGTSATRKPARRRFIGNGPGTENAAKAARTAQACLRRGAPPGVCAGVVRFDTRSHAARAEVSQTSAAADYVLTEASSGAPLPRHFSGGRLPPRPLVMVQVIERRLTRVVKPGG